MITPLLRVTLTILDEAALHSLWHSARENGESDEVLDAIDAEIAERAKSD